MKFYIAKPNKTKKYGKIIQRIEGFEIWKSNDKLYLYKGEYQLGSLYTGLEGLKKYYKSDFKIWIKKLREKDRKKIKKMKLGVRGVLNACRFIENLWEK